MMRTMKPTISERVDVESDEEMTLITKTEDVRLEAHPNRLVRRLRCRRRQNIPKPLGDLRVGILS